MESQYIMAIDQGTSGTKAIVLDREGKLIAKAAEPLSSRYLEGGLVEQDPGDILGNLLAAAAGCVARLKEAGADPRQIKALGISNQRESFLVWDKNGKPLCPVVVWQCRRSVSICERLQSSGMEAIISEKTGLRIDPYFSATKLIWLYENDPELRVAISSGEAYFGTIDSWLLYRICPDRPYKTDFTNASRTLLFNLQQCRWDEELLESFGLSGIGLPAPQPSASDFGQTDLGGILPLKIPVSAMIGDSHAAAFAEGCLRPGLAKATLGTGCSVMMNTGTDLLPATEGMVRTICWSMPGRTDFALEGLIISCGATLEWLKNELKLFSDIAGLEALAGSVTDNNGVYLVPAFNGLGTPYWEMSKKASISGLTFDCTAAHLARAALESIPYQVRDVISAMEAVSPVQLQELRVNGGISSNRFVLDFLAAQLGKPVKRSDMADASALGAALLAGLQAGLYKSLDALPQASQGHETILPLGDRRQHEVFYKGWKNALL